MEIKKYANDKISMDYIKFGKGNKTIIMVPGLSIKNVSNNAILIEEAYNEFANDFTIYCFDRIDNPKPNYSIKDMTNDLYTAIKELGLKDLYMLGASQGGMICLYFSMLHKSLVKKIVTASTPISLNDKSLTIINKWIDYAKESKREKLFTSFAKTIYPDSFYNDIKDIIIQQADTISDSDLERFIIMASALNKYDFSENIDKIDKDLLMICDLKDKLIKFKKNVSNKPNIKYYYFNEYGHALYDLEPKFKTLALKFFLGSDINEL